MTDTTDNSTGPETAPQPPELSEPTEVPEVPGVPTFTFGVTPRYYAAFTGFTDAPDNNWTATEVDDWPNCVMVDVTEGYARTTGQIERAYVDAVAGYADRGEVRMLVKVDTNYKDSRPGQHPVALTRGDAIAFAAAVLRAVAGTFDGRSTGTLRATEATELLAALGSVDGELAELREQALGDLRFELEKLDDPTYYDDVDETEKPGA